MDRYDPAMLDMLCLTGEVGWARLSPPRSEPGTSGEALSRLVGATPVALFLREHADLWQGLRRNGGNDRSDSLSAEARTLLEALRARGASFLRELGDAAAVVASIGELVAAGLVASDGFAGLRAIVLAASGRPSLQSGASRSGRWSLLRTEQVSVARDVALEAQARALLRRYGVVFRRLLLREATAAHWRELARVYRRLEARGEIRGGRFVSGMSGEQFALPDAVDRLREIRRTPADGRLIVISAADPLNLAGIVTAGDRVRGAASSRMAYLNGVPVAALEGDYIRPLAEIEPSISAGLATALAGRRLPPVTAGYVGRRVEQSAGSLDRA
jgi:ATP-dependent Lhr-like helicase